MSKAEAVRRAGAWVLTFVGLILAQAAHATQCETVNYQGNQYSVCRVDLAADDLRLFLYDDLGNPFGHFTSLQESLLAQGERLVFAMNGGMYHENRAPVGHYLENGQEVMRVVPNAGPGNFGLLPNGVLCIGDEQAEVIETLRYLDNAPNCKYATQSGPMLVIDGALHPAFLKDSTSRLIRNGVGTTDDGKAAVFTISDNAVSFHEFGSFFRDYLGLRQALFLEGNVSRLFAPSLGRADLGRRMGPIVGVVEPAS